MVQNKLFFTSVDVRKGNKPVKQVVRPPNDNDDGDDESDDDDDDDDDQVDYDGDEGETRLDKEEIEVGFCLRR